MNWEQLAQQSNEEIIAWASAQPWAIAMAQCQQDSRWHAEGDVWTHVKLVCNELYNLNEWAALTREEQLQLLFTALLHDAAKPMTTIVDPQTGHVSSPKHAVKGEFLARNVLRGINCDIRTREKIAKLVRYHGRPNFLAQRTHPEAEVIRLSWLTNNRLLYLFAIADSRGRDTDSKDRPVENLEYWKLLSQENHCYDEKYKFQSDHQRLCFFESDNPNLSYIPHEDFRCEVTMMAGLPGAGKDTWLSQHEPELPVVSLDETRREMKISPTDNQGKVAQVAKERCCELLRNRTSFAFNATNTMYVTRQRWLGLFRDYGARIRIVYLEPSLEKLLQQNRKRPHAVPESVIQKLSDKMEPPTWAECHERVWEC
jgi:predicted kinase